MSDYMNADGSFGDMAGAPQGMAEMVSTKGWANVEAITKSYSELEAHQGTIKQNLNLPETLSDDMVGMIHTKLGKPDSPDGYDFGDAGQALKPDVLTGIKGAAYTAGLSNTQVNAVMGQILKIANIETESEHNEEIAIEKAFKEKHGDNYETYMAKALAGSDKLGLTEMLDKYGINRKADVIDLMHEMDGKLSESPLKAAGGGGVDAQTIDSKIKQVISDPAFSDKMHIDHHTKITEWRELLAQKHNVAGQPAVS